MFYKIFSVLIFLFQLDLWEEGHLFQQKWLNWHMYFYYENPYRILQDVVEFQEPITLIILVGNHFGDCTTLNLALILLIVHEFASYICNTIRF